jgi:NADH:ubiquinone oxidoreductase subunit E
MRRDTMAKLPTRSPTHEDLPLARLSAMGLELDELADGAESIALGPLAELAEDRGRPASHYLAALAIGTELRVEPPPGATLTVRACVGTCQRWGALDVLDHLVERGGVALAPVPCLDRCDQAPACEVHGPHGVLVVAPATPAALDDALSQLSQ